MFQTKLQEDDESKIYKAENRAIKKRKMSTKMKNNQKHVNSQPSSTSLNSFSDYVYQVQSVSYLTCFVPQQPFLPKKQFGTTPFYVGRCYVCGDYYQRECPLIVRSRSQPEASEFVKDECLLNKVEYYEHRNQSLCSVKVKVGIFL